VITTVSMPAAPPRADPLPMIKGVLIAGAIALLLLIALPWGRGLIVEAGRNIEQRDMETDYLWGLGWALALGATFFAWPVSRAERSTLLWLWLAKIEMMLGFMLLYEWNYWLDAFNYWFGGGQDLVGLSDLNFGDGSSLVLYLSHLQWDYLLGSSYHANKVTFGYVGLIGTVVYYRAACAFLRKRDTRILWLLGLVPSALQWSSILGKDPLAYTAIGLYAWGVVRLYRQPSLWSIAAIGCGIFGASYIRPWMAAILLAPLTVFGLFSLRGVLSRILLGSVVAVGFFGALSIFSDVLHVSSVDDVVDQTQAQAQAFDTGGSANQSALEHDNSVEKMIVFAPLGIASALFRPLPGEVPNIFGFLASLENVALLWLTVRAFRRSRLKDLADPVLLWAMTLVLSWSLVYGFVCYHNAGTGVRYRFQIFPVLIGVVAYLARSRRPAGQAG
jgi:hypothetical protein